MSHELTDRQTALMALLDQYGYPSPPPRLVQPGVPVQQRRWRRRLPLMYVQVMHEARDACAA